MVVRMTKRYISPQSGPVEVKTDKDRHTPRTGHTEAAGRQNKAYTHQSHEYVPATAQVRAKTEDYGTTPNPYKSEEA